jgi:hypothetical protein
MATAADVKAALAGPPAKANKSNPLVNKLKTELAEVAASKSRLVQRMKDGKIQIARTVGSALHTGEGAGTLFLASMAEGYFGEEKIKIGPVDMRLALAIPLDLAGLALTASDHGAAGHVSALGNGLGGAWLASAGIRAGKAVRESKDRKAAGATEPAPSTGADVDKLREIAMTGGDDVEATQDNRFRRVRSLPE